MTIPSADFKSVIFDVDGVLIDSEPFWRESEREVFARYGLALAEADCILTTGMRIQEVAQFWYDRQPWQGASTDEVAAEILAGVIRRIRERGTAMPGLADAIRLFRSRGLRLALASSSARSLIDTVLARLAIGSTFEVVVSAENGLRGKPEPDVYLAAARMLALPPMVCLAIEDSIAGVQSAKAAGMKCLAVPLPELRGDPRYQIADSVVDSLAQIDCRIMDKLFGR
jgi:mannitol-1-/sugar-/sorbitol-6-/2-deoxyglucose-6-phosphatase